MRFPVFALLCLLSVGAAAERGGNGLARQHYILNCQGCHLHDGSGSEGAVPSLKDFVGNFLQVPGGREFIVQVPGVAGAPISDTELAGVMNWMLLNFSRRQLPDDFRPYTAAEVASLRQSPLLDVKRARARLIRKLERVTGIKE